MFASTLYLVDTHKHTNTQCTSLIHTNTQTYTLYFSRRGATSLAREMVVPEIPMRYR
jgi:hypothetical protein